MHVQVLVKSLHDAYGQGISVTTLYAGVAVLYKSLFHTLLLAAGFCEISKHIYHFLIDVLLY